MKRCIFHIPYKLDSNAMAAPMLRPRKLIEGFQSIGYEVDVVAGNAKERKEAIKKIKRNIRNGVHYDFMYAESSTMPTLLTEPHHMPTHPFMDFSFFSFCKKNGIKIGLFYRDVYWKFDSYKEALATWKSVLAIMCYKYDLLRYKGLVERLYLPDKKVYKYLSDLNIENRVETLPPGCEDIFAELPREERDFTKKPLNIFYVGGLGNQYQIEELFKAINMVECCELTVCCREHEWNNEKDKLHKYVSDKVHIIHKSSHELEEYYSKADMCSLLFKPDIYIEMAMPYKSFEYLAHLKPVLVTEKTAIGEFVKENEIGWSIEYSADAIAEILSKIIEQPQLLSEKISVCADVKGKNTWGMRALKVANDLK